MPPLPSPPPSLTDDEVLELGRLVSQAHFGAISRHAATVAMHANLEEALAAGDQDRATWYAAAVEQVNTAVYTWDPTRRGWRIIVPDVGETFVAVSQSAGVST